MVECDEERDLLKFKRREWSPSETRLIETVLPGEYVQLPVDHFTFSQWAKVDRVDDVVDDVVTIWLSYQRKLILRAGSNVQVRSGMTVTERVIMRLCGGYRAYVRDVEPGEAYASIALGCPYCRLRRSPSSVDAPLAVIRPVVEACGRSDCTSYYRYRNGKRANQYVMYGCVRFPLGVIANRIET